MYFYNGKLFGLRAGEHTLIHLSHVVEGNKIVFDEFRGKTYKGCLKDLKNIPRYIEHICHENRQSHSPCLASMYSVYIEKIPSHAESIDSFYFRPHRGGKFEYEKSLVGLCTLNKIVGKGRIASQDGTLSSCYLCYSIVSEFSRREIGEGKNRTQVQCTFRLSKG